MKGIKRYSMPAIILIILLIMQGCKNNNGNPYFFKEDKTVIQYEGYFIPLSTNEIWQKINLNIIQIKKFENGILFFLELDDLDVTDIYDTISMGGRYLGYFFVSDDTIYRIQSINMAGFTRGEIIEEHERVIQLIQEGGDSFIKECVIVCNEEGTENTADENGWHEYVEVDGDRRIFHMYNDYVSGTKEYEQIIWEKGKGITYYKHGAGNMLMHVELGINLYENMEDYNN